MVLNIYYPHINRNELTALSFTFEFLLHYTIVSKYRSLMMFR